MNVSHALRFESGKHSRGWIVSALSRHRREPEDERQPHDAGVRRKPFLNVALLLAVGADRIPPMVERYLIGLRMSGPGNIAIRRS